MVSFSKLVNAILAVLLAVTITACSNSSDDTTSLSLAIKMLLLMAQLKWLLNLLV